MTLTDILFALATWRITHLLVSEDAPYSLAARFRNYIGIRYDMNSKRVAGNELAKLFMCVWCLSVWVGWVLALLVRPRSIFLARGLAYSAVSIVIERLVSR